MINNDPLYDEHYFIIDKEVPEKSVSLITKKLRKDMPEAIDAIVYTNMGDVASYIVPGDTAVPNNVELRSVREIGNLDYINSIKLIHPKSSF